MNRVFQVVWSKETGTWVVVSELASRTRGGPTRSRRVAARNGMTRIATLLFALLGPWTAHAQSLHWDGTDTDANANGGNGTWQTGTANWDGAASGGANTPWNSGLPNDAIFGGTAGTVTIAAGGVSAGSLTFNTSGYTLGGGPLTFGGGVATVSGNATINAVLAGTNGLVKTGGGVLHVDGPAPSVFDVVNVQDGEVHVGPDGDLVDVVALTVAQGATLRVDGTVSGTVGDDLMDIAGQVAGVGAVGLGAGNDSLLLHAGADTRLLAQAIDGGDGVDVIDAQVDAGTLSLGATENFEALEKHGDGAMTLAADATFEATQLFGGTFAVDAGATLSSRATLLADGTTLRVDGAFSGTDGDDTFQSAGTIVGSLAFGSGDDRVDFTGGSLAGLVAFDGGAGTDALHIHGMTLAAMPAFAGVERVSLRDGTTLGLSQALQLGGGVLSIDATSMLEAGAGARIGGSVENAGAIDVGAGRVAIDGDYFGSGDATLAVVVSAGTGTSGGLDIAGDVHGTTRIRFDNDGTSAHGATSIEIIHSPNDATGEGTFVSTEARDGVVRLSGSILNWVFAQDAGDGNWYLSTEGFGEGAVLPEVPAYGALPMIGALSARASSAMALRHAANACEGSDAATARPGAASFGDCGSAWAAVSLDEVRVGADPGAAFSGDRHGLYVGANIFGYGDRASTWRGGVFVGLQRGNDWTTGEASEGLAAIAGANVRSESHAFGAYANAARASGWHLEGTAIGQLNEADVVAVDGFSQKVVGESLSFDVRVGRAFTTQAGWTFDPRVHLGVLGLRWRDVVDASGKALRLAGDVLTTARAEFHAERTFPTAGGTQWRPWATLGVENTFGDNAEALHVVQGDIAQALPNHATGTSATFDLGLEVRTSAKVSLFGSASYGASLSGTDTEHRQATFGARLRW